MSLIDRVAGGPISWGVCEVPGWGLQLPVDRVLTEMRAVGLAATELGAIGWLPTDAGELRSMLDAHEMHATGAFVPLVAHDPARRDEAINTAVQMATLLEAVECRALRHRARERPRRLVAASAFRRPVGPHGRRHR